MPINQKRAFPPHTFLAPPLVTSQVVNGEMRLLDLVRALFWKEK